MPPVPGQQPQLDAYEIAVQILQATEELCVGPRMSRSAQALAYAPAAAAPAVASGGLTQPPQTSIQPARAIDNAAPVSTATAAAGGTVASGKQTRSDSEEDDEGDISSSSSVSDPAEDVPLARGRAAAVPAGHSDAGASTSDAPRSFAESGVPASIPAWERAFFVIFTDAEGKKRRGGRAPSGHLGFTIFHPDHGRRYAHAQVPPSIIKLLDAIKQRDTYIGQFELIAAITPFISLPADWLEGRQVELWIDNSGAIGGLLRGYSGIPDCARIVNIFKFATAKLCLASLYIDYVPSESNPADIPSRLHEMDDDEAADAVADLGDFMEMTIPDFADDEGRWLSFADIAASVWGE
jgi:hypothetical protein